MVGTGSFPFSYGVFRLLLSVLGMGPAFSGVELGDGTLRVRMGWAFRASVPVQHITGARPRTGLVGGIGVHGWKGRWLVNGATTGLVQIAVDPPGRAYVMGVPVKVRELTLSLEDPDSLIAALKR